MGASGGISYVVLKREADYKRFASLMGVLPVNTSDAGVYDYTSFDPPEGTPEGTLFKAYWRDTYEAFSLEGDLLEILESINTDFEDQTPFPLSISSNFLWEEVLEDWKTSPYRSYWPYAWRLVVEHLPFVKENPILKMTLKEWAAEVKSMIATTGYQETWT